MAEIIKVHRSDRTKGKSIWGSEGEENHV
jgi:hypothetical protein